MKNEKSLAMKDLQTAVQDLQQVRPGRGILKTLFNVSLLGTLIGLGLTAEFPWPGLGWGLLAALAYASVFVTTHDAIHHTLTGFRAADELIGRLIAYPGLWFHGTYSELHRLHHKMNGNDLRDPERPHWSESEYRSAPAWKRWYIRHQWPIDMFVLGGFGMIAANVVHGWRWSRQIPSVRRALRNDVLGLLLVNAAIYGAAFATGKTLRWVMLYLLFERVVGIVHQMRSHLEHYGLWGRLDPAIETQLFNSRNIETSALVSLYFNGLNFHSVHHAFPRVPFYHLEEAHRRLSAVVGTTGRRLPTTRRYFATAWRLARSPLVIRDRAPGTPAVPIAALGA